MQVGDEKLTINKYTVCRLETQHMESAISIVHACMQIQHYFNHRAIIITDFIEIFPWNLHYAMDTPSQDLPSSSSINPSSQEQSNPPIVLLHE